MRKRGILLFSFLFIWSVSTFAQQSTIKIYRYNQPLCDYAVQGYYEIDVDGDGLITEIRHKEYVGDRLAASSDEDEQIAAMTDAGITKVTNQDGIINICNTSFNIWDSQSGHDQSETCIQLKKTATNSYEVFQSGDNGDLRYKIVIDNDRLLHLIYDEAIYNIDVTSAVVTSQSSTGRNNTYYLDSESGTIMFTREGAEAPFLQYTKVYSRIDKKVWEAVIAPRNDQNPDNKILYRIELNKEVSEYSFVLWLNTLIPQGDIGVHLWPFWWLLKS